MTRSYSFDACRALDLAPIRSDRACMLNRIFLFLLLTGCGQVVMTDDAVDAALYDAPVPDAATPDTASDADVEDAVTADATPACYEHDLAEVAQRDPLFLRPSVVLVGERGGLGFPALGVGVLGGTGPEVDAGEQLRLIFNDHPANALYLGMMSDAAVDAVFTMRDGSTVSMTISGPWRQVDDVAEVALQTSGRMVLQYVQYCDAPSGDDYVSSRRARRTRPPAWRRPG